MRKQKQRNQNHAVHLKISTTRPYMSLVACRALERIAECKAPIIAKDPRGNQAPGECHGKQEAE